MCVSSTPFRERVEGLQVRVKLIACSCSLTVLVRNLFEAFPYHYSFVLA